MFENYTYIVTGATGYVGGVFVKKLMSLGCNVLGFARSEKKAKRVFGDNLPKMIYGDITKKEDVERLFDNADENFVVIHTVAKVSIGEASKEELMSVTVDGTKNVVNECVKHKVRKLIHISSTEALPKNTELDKNLTDYIPNPDKCRKGYGRTKAMADKLVLEASKEVDVSVIMFASVLGPGDYTNGHMQQMFIDYIEEKLPASIKGGYNDFDIRDVADVLPNIIEKSRNGECYVFAHQPNTINDSLDVIAEKLGKKKLVTLPIWIAYLGVPIFAIMSKISGKRPLYTSSALATLKEKADFSIEKARKEFGYNPRPLKETVGDQVDFLIKEGMVKL